MRFTNKNKKGSIVLVETRVKKVSSLILGLLIVSLFSNCSSAQFDKKAPFSINKASQQDWVGGVEGVKGVLVMLELPAAAGDQVVFDSLFFRGKKLKLEHTITEEKLLVFGNFVSNNATDKNIIMHADTQEEFGNKAPDVLFDFPFKLSDNECVISYSYKGKKRYFKVENLLQEKTLRYQ